MEKLISDSEKTFFHYFSPENEANFDIGRFVSQEEFAMNSLTDIDSFLMKDKHYNEMYEDVKRYCDPEFAKKASHLDRYYVVLGGLLRPLLRATGAFDPYERKELIETVYAWYREKRRLLLEYRLKSRRALDTSTKEKVKKIVPADVEAVTLEDLDQRSKRTMLPEINSPMKSTSSAPLMRTPRSVASGESGEFGSLTKQLPVYVNQEKKKELFISSKLKQYSRRDLASSHQQRLKRLEEKKSADQKQAGSWMSTSEQSFQSTSDQKVLPNPRLLAYKGDFDFSKTNVYQHWLEHRARDAEEELENVEISETISTWASNRARIEEEIHRRQEASRYSSQTGINVHKAVKASDIEIERRKNKERLDELRENAFSFLDSDSEFSDDDAPPAEPTKPVVIEKAKESEDVAEDDENDSDDQTTANSEEEESGQMWQEVKRPLFLSPYNNLDKVTYQFRPPSPLHSNMELMSSGELEAARKGFVRPMTTGASNLPRTPILNYHRELEDTAVSDETGRQIRRPRTVGVFKTDFTPLGGKHIHFTNPEKEFFHSVLDRDGLVEDIKPKTKKRPSSSKGNKGGKAKKGSKKDSAPEPAAPVLAEPVPPPPRPPSLLRSAQLDECDRIKISMARGGWSLPIKTIESSILIPEDISHEECRTKLPRGNFFNLECVMAEEEKAKKTTKKTKKKGKKGKKKKK